MWAMVRHNGCMYKVRKHPTETEEQAKDRAWYVATKLAPTTPPAERESLSRAWANEKYYGIEYGSVASDANK